MADLGQLSGLGKGTAEEGEKVFFTDANGDPVSDAYMVVIGRNSDTFKREKFKHLKRVAKHSKNRTMKEIEADNVSLLSYCILDWNFTDKGKKVPLTKENKVNILLEHPLMQEQIDVFITDDTNFMKSADKA